MMPADPNTLYVVDTLATGGSTVTIDDTDGGIDTISVAGTYTSVVDINLNYNDGGTQSGSGIYYFGGPGSRLIVHGTIENALGSNGADTIQGNSSNNVIYGDQTDSSIGGKDTLYGGDGNDTMYGGADEDLVSGESGDDWLFGGAGDDTINGGSGIDVVHGGAGADILSGGADIGDTVSYSGSGAAVVIRLEFGSTKTGSGGDAQGDTLTGFTDIIGSSFADTLVDLVKTTIAFNYNKNVFDGGAGNDTIMLGGGDDTGLGGIGRDLVSGEVGNDTLYGGSGADELIGGLGRDRLTGDTGADDFIFKKVAESRGTAAKIDRITDFSHSEGDHIVLSSIDAVSGKSGNQAFDFVGQSFGGHAGELIFMKSAGFITVMGDVNGDGDADFAIRVDGLSRITASDFIL